MKKDKKKGSTLIELLLAISISLIVIPLVLNIFLYQIKTYNKTLQNNKNCFSVNEAFMYIQHQVKNNTKEVNVGSKELLLFKTNNTEKHQISIHNNNLVITYYKKYGDIYYYNGSNNILTKIQDFNVEQYNNYINISIDYKNGKRYSRCISLKK